MRSVIQQKLWKIGLRNALRSNKTSCLLRRKLRAQNNTPLIADLPPERLDFRSYPFTNVVWIISVRLMLNCYEEL